MQCYSPTTASFRLHCVLSECTLLTSICLHSVSRALLVFSVVLFSSLSSGDGEKRRLRRSGVSIVSMEKGDGPEGWPPLLSKPLCDARFTMACRVKDHSYLDHFTVAKCFCINLPNHSLAGQTHPSPISSLKNNATSWVWRLGA